MRGHFRPHNGTFSRNHTLAVSVTGLAPLRGAAEESWAYAFLFAALALVCLCFCAQACNRDRFSVKVSDRRRAEQPLEKLPLIVIG
jgi:hypothetical protein